jgi:hypothetical protein
VPDEYVHILVAYVVMKAFRERLIKYLGNPSVFTELVGELTATVEKAEKLYFKLVDNAVARLAESRTSPHMEADKFDRIY